METLKKMELESPEKEFWGKLFSKSNKREFQGAIACSLPDIDILAYNRVLGLAPDFYGSGTFLFDE